MTEEQIEELGRLEKAATPAPWDAGTGHSGRIFGPNGEIAFWDANDDASDWPADVVLATVARNALPRLLEERRRLLDALRECKNMVTADEYWYDEERHRAEAAIAYAEESG